MEFVHPALIHYSIAIKNGQFICTLNTCKAVKSEFRLSKCTWNISKDKKTKQNILKKFTFGMVQVVSLEWTCLSLLVTEVCCTEQQAVSRWIQYKYQFTQQRISWSISLIQAVFNVMEMIQIEWWSRVDWKSKSNVSVVIVTMVIFIALGCIHPKY